MTEFLIITILVVISIGLVVGYLLDQVVNTMQDVHHNLGSVDESEEPW